MAFTSDVKDVAAYTLSGLTLANIIIFFLPDWEPIKAELSIVFNMIIFVIKKIVDYKLGIKLDDTNDQGTDPK